MPDHEFATGRTEVGEFAIGALQADRVLHDAIWIGAMFQAKGMAQFVDGLFFQTIYERRAADCGITVGIAAQTITRDNGTLALELGLTKYKGEDGIEEVHMSQAQDFKGIRSRLVDQLPQNQIGVVLLSTSIQSIDWNSLIGTNLNWQVELLLDAFCDDFKMFIAHIPQGYQVDELGVIFHDSLLLSFQAELLDLFVQGGTVDIQQTC